MTAPRLTGDQQLLASAVIAYANRDPLRDMDWQGSVARALLRLVANSIDKVAVRDALARPYCPWCGELDGWCVETGGPDRCEDNGAKASARAGMESAPIVYIGGSYRVAV